MAPCNYHRMTHQVCDKRQARGVRGKVRPETQQPIRGKSLGGGQRFGEMEMQALLMHGSSLALEDRMMVNSDGKRYATRPSKRARLLPGQLWACSLCGHLANTSSDPSRGWCNVCSSSDYCILIQSLATYATFLQELASIGVAVKHEFQPLKVPSIKK